MSRTLVETQVGGAAEQFVRECLADGNTLARLALGQLSPDQGKIVTCLPEGVTPLSVRDFRTGGKLPLPPTSEWKSTESRGETLLMIPVPTTDTWLVSKINEHLLGSPRNVCLFEDALRSPADSKKSQRTIRVATYSDEVYHVLLHEDAQTTRIEATIRAVRSGLPIVGVLSVWPSEDPNEGLDPLSLAQLAGLAASLQKIVVGAYDGEGYLVWNRRASGVS